MTGEDRGLTDDGNGEWVVMNGVGVGHKNVGTRTMGMNGKRLALGPNSAQADRMK